MASAAQKYATLLKISGPTVRAEDPKAQIVFAGMPGFAEWRAWSFLDAVYEIPGARAHFDVTALQPYAHDVAGVEFQMKQFRASMTRHADGPTPVWVTEFAWGSGPPDASGHNKGPTGQRQLLINSFNLFLSQPQAVEPPAALLVPVARSPGGVGLREALPASAARRDSCATTGPRSPPTAPSGASPRRPPRRW